MSKEPNIPIVVFEAKELLQFLNKSGASLVLHRLGFLLIHLQFSRTHYMPEVFHLRLAKLIFFNLFM